MIKFLINYVYICYPFRLTTSKLLSHPGYIRRGVRSRTSLRIFFALGLLSCLTYSYNLQPLFAESAEITTQTVHELDDDALIFLEKSEECQREYASFIEEPGEIYCNATFDQYLCWPPTKAGSNVSQSCPTDVLYVDRNNFATRQCGTEGRWLDQDRVGSKIGWTNYNKCFSGYLQGLLENMAKSKDFASKFTIAGWVRAIEFLGTAISNVALIGALVVFKIFPSLRNLRTRVHVHLFRVLLTQGTVCLFIFTDQQVFKILSLHNTLCKLVYTSVEQLTSNSFCFMFVEGLTIYSSVNAKSLRPTVSFRACLLFAYFFPLLNVIIWTSVAAERYKNEWCWFGYNLDSMYWILQTPRLIIIIINLFLLFGVIRILITKMSQYRTTELERISKAVRATVILMPLLGITNFLSMTNAPLSDTSLQFAFWAFFAYVFKSFQGLMISFLFCYKNAEVREAFDIYRRTRKRKNTLNSSVRTHANFTETEFEMFRRDGEPSRLTSLIPVSVDATEECPVRIMAVDSGEATGTNIGPEEVEEAEKTTIDEVNVEVHSDPYNDEQESVM